MLLLIGCPLSILAQNKTLTGTVRDAIDVVIGASVTVKGDKSIGTITDMDGNFKLSVPVSAKELVVRLLVMKIKLFLLVTNPFCSYAQRIFSNVGRGRCYWVCEGET